MGGVGYCFSQKQHHSPLAAGPAETVGQVGHLPYHFLVVHTDSRYRLAAFAVTQCSGKRYCLVQSRLISMTIAWASRDNRMGVAAICQELSCDISGVPDPT